MLIFFIIFKTTKLPKKDQLKFRPSKRLPKENGKGRGMNKLHWECLDQRT